MRTGKKKFGSGTIAALIALNLTLGGLSIRDVYAFEGDDCQDEEDECRCVGSICEEDDLGYLCLKGWHPIEGEWLFNPIIDPPGGGPYTCGEAN